MTDDLRKGHIKLPPETVASLQDAKKALDEQLASRVTVQITFPDAESAEQLAQALDEAAGSGGVETTAEAAWLADTCEDVAEQIREQIETPSDTVSPVTDRSIDQEQDVRYVCGACGNDEEFAVCQTEEVTLKVGYTGEYVEELDVRTTDRFDMWCLKCDSRNIVDIG